MIPYYRIHTVLYLELFYHNIHWQLFQMSFFILYNYLILHRQMNHSLLISPMLTVINIASGILNMYESVCRMNSLKWHWLGQGECVFVFLIIMCQIAA